MPIYQLKISQLFFVLLTFCFIFIPNSAWAIQKDIVILYTNDVHCGIEDNLGYTKLAQYKEDVQQDTPYITLLDAVMPFKVLLSANYPLAKLSSIL